MRTDGYAMRGVSGCARRGTPAHQCGENEDVGQKLFKRHTMEVEEIQDLPSWAEKRKYGAMVLPDKSGGRGPMYFCLLKKVKHEE